MLAVKRLGQEVIGIDDSTGLVEINIKLSHQPEYEWEEFVKNPTEWSIKPRTITFLGNSIVITCEEEKIEKTLEWMDKYITQANIAYDKLIQEKERKRKEMEAKKEQKIKEIQKLNEKIQNF